LTTHGCDEVQGYYFSPPLLMHQLERMLLTATDAEAIRI
jgi:EAL domain-containing protein (putative c-di-GMP-specific phosphodiesterase class I)